MYIHSQQFMIHFFHELKQKRVNFLRTIIILYTHAGYFPVCFFFAENLVDVLLNPLMLLICLSFVLLKCTQVLLTSLNKKQDFLLKSRSCLYSCIRNGNRLQECSTDRCSRRHGSHIYRKRAELVGMWDNHWPHYYM